MWGDIAIAFLLAFLTSFVITPYTIKLAKKVGAVDSPKEERRINTTEMPRLRRNSRYTWLFSSYNIFANHNANRGNNKFIWRRKLHY